MSGARRVNARSQLFEKEYRFQYLGLATVYGIVNQTGGFIAVQSAQGAGTRFEISFPAHRNS